MLWKALLQVNKREHLEVYVLASVANALLSLGQFFAVYSARGIRISQQTTVASLLGYDGSRSTLWMDFVRSGLIFQGIMAVLVIGVLGATISKARWNWPYALTGVVLSSYVAFVLGGKFLDMLEWVQLDHSFGVPSYADLIVFGLGSTICYFLMILVLNKSYGKLVVERTG
jgi:hypothetical protein